MVKAETTKTITKKRAITPKILITHRFVIPCIRSSFSLPAVCNFFSHFSSIAPFVLVA